MANLGDIASQAEDTNGIEVVLGVNIHLREKPIGLSEGEIKVYLALLKLAYCQKVKGLGNFQSTHVQNMWVMDIA